MTIDAMVNEISSKLMAMIEAKRKKGPTLMSTYPLVGAFYRPPAKALIDVLPIGTPLTLIAEPENAYDPFAVAVWLYSRDIPEGNAHEKLRETLPPFGTDLETVLSQEVHHLGYIAKELARKLREEDTVPVDSPVEGTFSLSSGGAPRVRLTDG